MFINRIMFWLSSLMLLLNLLWFPVVIQAATEVLRPRGVPLSKKSFYDAGKDFQCLDGSATVPFLLVNDDYCDCDDGSDEPGTSACPNGLFHCSNIGFIEKIIPSSRVNDGICDCCDASDEYNSSAKCPNNCLELGEQMRVERERYLELLKQGNEIRQTYIENAKQRIEETKKELESLKTNLAEAEELKNTKLETKNQAEELEKEALEKHRAKEEELRKQREEEENKKREIQEHNLASAAFKQFDSNSDGFVTIDEMKAFVKFDRDNDGIVSDDEAKFHMNGLEKVDLQAFIESSWTLVKPILEREHELEEERKALENAANDYNAAPPVAGARPNTPEDEDEQLTHEEESMPEHEETSDELEHEAEIMAPAITPPPLEPTPLPVTLEYDESTSRLVEEAKKARDEYNEAEAKYQDVQTKIREMEVLLEMDFGPNGEYMALKDQCFELHENEYVYKLCPFESASQRSKAGGTETSLGRWGKWIGGEQNQYERFIMEGGAQCWNGPARSVIVHVSCGAENQLTRATEPNRCEYAFDFKTPAACIINSETASGHQEHTEL